MKVALGPGGAVEAAGAEPAQEPGSNAARMAEAARQFEAVLLRRMLSALEKTTSLQSGKGGSMYGSMIVDAMADAITSSGGLGMSKLIEDSLPGTKANDDR
jgi:Rod binding domain-containing protein